jgi:hypothetical protein
VRLAAESSQLRGEIMKVADQFLAARQKAASSPANEVLPAIATPASEQDAGPARPRRTGRARSARAGSAPPVPTRAAE